MKTSKFYLYLAINLLFLIFYGCHWDLLTDKSKNNTVPSSSVPFITGDIVFDEKGITYAPICNNMQVEDGNVYFQSTDAITCYDISSKREKWKKKSSDIFKKAIKVGSWNIVITEKNIYVPCHSESLIAVVDKNTGETLQIIEFSDPQILVWGENLYFYNNGLFFCGGDIRSDYSVYTKDGLYRLDLTNLRKKENGNEIYYIGEIQPIFQYPRNSCAITGIHGDGKYGYLAWYPVNSNRYPNDPGKPFGIACVDLETGETVWEDNQYDPGAGGRIKAITDKYVFATVTEEGIPRGRGGTGVYYKEKRDGSQLKNVLWYVWSSDTNFTWDQEGKRIYLASGANTESNPLVAAIICIDAEEGTVIWKRFRSAQEPQIGMQPQVRNGVLYQVTSRYLELYDAQTGTPLGRDTRVYGDAINMGDTTTWNDILIFHDGMKRAFGVKMNWKIENGALVKE